jgi:hypothetical protein
MPQPGRDNIERQLSMMMMYRTHATLAVVWLLLVIPSWFVWRNSIFWVIFISLYANFVSHWGAWQAVRAELVAGRAEAAARAAVELVRLQAVEDDRDQAEVLARIERAVTDESG